MIEEPASRRVRRYSCGGESTCAGRRTESNRGDMNVREILFLLIAMGSGSWMLNIEMNGSFGPTCSAVTY